MNIGILCFPSYGGSGVVATELGVLLAQQGHQVHFLAYDRPFRLKYNPNIFFHEITTNSYPLFRHSLYTVATASKLVDVVRSFKLDVLHVHYAVPHSISAFLAKQSLGEMAPRVITTLHGTDITLVGQDASYKPMVELGISASDGVTAVSNYLADETHRNFKVSKDIQVVYNFVDYHRFSKANVCQDGIRKYADERLVIHVSNFRKVKNTLAVVDTFNKINISKPKRLVLVGEGPELASVKQRVKELHLMEQVTFMGSIDDVECVIPLADVLLLPSLTESFGLTALEAMSCEVPPVTSNRGGLPEVITPGETGFMADPDDTDTMAEYASQIMSDPELRVRMGHQGREFAKAQFAPEKIVKDYINLYKGNEVNVAEPVL